MWVLLRMSERGSAFAIVYVSWLVRACVCVRACQSLCVSASEAKIHVIKRIASNILD